MRIHVLILFKISKSHGDKDRDLERQQTEKHMLDSAQIGTGRDLISPTSPLAWCYNLLQRQKRASLPPGHPDQALIHMELITHTSIGDCDPALLSPVPLLPHS